MSARRREEAAQVGGGGIQGTAPVLSEVLHPTSIPPTSTSFNSQTKLNCSLVNIHLMFQEGLPTVAARLRTVSRLLGWCSQGGPRRKLGFSVVLLTRGFSGTRVRSNLPRQPHQRRRLSTLSVRSLQPWLEAMKPCSSALYVQGDGVRCSTSSPRRLGGSEILDDDATRKEKKRRAFASRNTCTFLGFYDNLPVK